MQKRLEQYLKKAKEFEAKAEKAENPTLKLTYQELARSYRTLAEHATRGILLK